LSERSSNKHDIGTRVVRIIGLCHGRAQPDDPKKNSPKVDRQVTFRFFVSIKKSGKMVRCQPKETARKTT